MTPLEASKLVDQMEPAHFKMAFLRLLEWQAARGKSLVHVGWYLHHLKYEQEPRVTKAGEANHRRLERLVQGIGVTDA